MVAIGEDIWIQPGDAGTQLGKAQQTFGVVVRLPDGGLWLHAPVNLTPARTDALHALGPIAHIVAPNRNHGTFVKDWQQRARHAQLWVSPLFPRHHPDVMGHRILSNTAPLEWQDDILVCLFPGANPPDELVFLHRPSRTLILADLLRRQEDLFLGAFWSGLVSRARKAAAPAANGRMSADMRFNLRHRSAARAARSRILAWDFDRVLMANSSPVDTDGKAFFAEATAFLG